MINHRHTLRQAVVRLSLAAPLLACGGTKPSTPSPATTVSTSTPAPTPTALPTATPTPTATPSLTCEFSMSEATFEPGRVNCPVGTTSQTLRLVFDLTAANGLPISVNRVTSSGVRCQISGGSCAWGEADLSYSPNRAASGERIRIVATQQFTCGASGSPRAGAQLFFDSLVVATSCGSARKTAVSNSLVIGL